MVLANAIKYLEKFLKDPKWSRSGALPSLRALARGSGYSHYTLWKAVKNLEKRGMLAVSQGRRTRLTGNAKADAEPEATCPANVLKPLQAKWEDLAEILATEILRGRFRPGEMLPSIKELRNHYRVSHPTLKKSVNALVDRQLLVRNIKSYQVRPQAEPPPRSTLVYLAWGNESGNFKPGTSFEHEIISALENECSRHRIRLEKIAYNFRGDSLVFHKAGHAQHALPDSCRNALGILVRTVCNRDVVPALIPMVAGLQKPTVVMDEMGSVALTHLAGNFSHLKVFDHTIGGEPAMKMGQYLFSLGHRKVAFLSPWHGTIWSRRRLEGLAKVFGSKGGPAGLGEGMEVVPITLDLPYQLPFEEEETPTSRLMMRELEMAGRHWKSAYPPLPDLLYGLKPHMNRIAWKEMTLARMAQPLAEVLHRKDITAWVAVDDDTALIALEFLRRAGVQVPEQVSLTGCDDTPESSRNCLTSYNFNFSGLVQALLLFILNPPGLHVRGGRKLLDLEGRIVSRGTVGKGPFYRK